MAEKFKAKLEASLKEAREEKQAKERQENLKKLIAKMQDNADLKRHERDVARSNLYNEKGVSEGQNGQKSDVWKKVEFNAKKLMEVQGEGFREWATNMFEIISALQDLVDALNYSSESMFGELKNFAGDGLDFVKNSAWPGVKGRGMKAIDDIGNAFIMSPDLMKNIAIENGKLVSSLESSMGIDCGGEVDDYFKLGVGKWLTEACGLIKTENQDEYKMPYNNGLYSLTQHAFEQIAEKHDLATFINSKLNEDLTVDDEKEEENHASPSPRP